MATARRSMSVTLELSEEEARTLAAVLSYVGGCPTDSPRKHTDAVLEALTESAGLGSFVGTVEHNLADPERGIYFRNYPA